MTDLGPVLTRLGLEQYHAALVGEGFDTWETVLDIQESDLDILRFKLGHRRKLQREIANHRGISFDRSLGFATNEGINETVKGVGDSSTQNEVSHRSVQPGGETKRKYRRHPKPDENAPERPPSAYVIFSNRVREEVRDQNMNFTGIAKLVGDRWQKLDPEGKEPYEAQATVAKEKYGIELARYKKTDAYREYSQYLADFKAKHAGSVTDHKRPKLEQGSSGGSLSAKSTEGPDVAFSTPAHTLTSSVTTGDVATVHGGVAVPFTNAAGPATAFAVQNITSISARLPPISPRTDTPPLSLPPRRSASFTPFSPQNSVSDDSLIFRDQPDPLPHAAQLSLLPNPSRIADPPLPSPLSATLPGGSNTSRRSFQARTPLQFRQTSSSSVSSSSLPSSISTCSTSTVVINSPVEGPQRLQPSKQPLRDRSEFLVSSQPPLSTNSALPFAAMPLPPLVAGGRIPESTRDQSLRTLPPPTPYPPHGQHQALRNLPRPSETLIPRQQDYSHPDLSLSQRSKIPLDRSESEAADALAGLAYTTSVRQRARRNDGKRKPP